MADDEHFSAFASSLEDAIDRYGLTRDWNARQRAQMERLMRLEKRFRRTLLRGLYGNFMYRRFVEFICDEQANILDARPYFRERQGVFAQYISSALKERDHKALQRFSINFLFADFVMRQRRWGASAPLRAVFDDIVALRKEIVTMNLPLCINRARLFYSRTPESHLSQMDLIQIGTVGLMSGVDKYAAGEEGVVTKQFRSTAMGRMGGNFIEEYSDPMLHFFPIDKRKLYRANKIVGKSVGAVDFERVADGVNEKGDVKTTPDEMADLMAAASTVSSDSSLPSDPDAPEPVTRFAAPESARPDVQFEQDEAMGLMKSAIAQLTVFEQKLLRLKGVGFSKSLVMEPT